MKYLVSEYIVSSLTKEELVAVAKQANAVEYKGDNVWLAVTELDCIAVKSENGTITVLAHEER